MIAAAKMPHHPGKVVPCDYGRHPIDIGYDILESA
jgi:hypothetical protein